MKSKGSMSLEMIVKWIIMLVVVLVAIGLITVFSGRIKESVQNLFHKNNDQSVYVRVGLIGTDQQLSKIAELIDLCYNAKLGQSRDETCYIVHNKNGDFSITKEQIKERLPGGLADKMIFKDDEFDSETIVISYGWVDETVVLEQ